MRAARRRIGTCSRCLAEGRVEHVEGRELCRLCARRARRHVGTPAGQLELDREERQSSINTGDWGGF